MSYFEVKGGISLSGEIIPQGSKNEALQVLSTTLLTNETLLIENVPEIIDVLNHLKLLESLGTKVVKIRNNTYSLKTEVLTPNFYLQEKYQKLCSKTRGSITILGVLSQSLEKFQYYLPGGDNIGRRPLDAHINGLGHLDVDFSFHKNQQRFEIKTKQKLTQKTYILMEEASVTGTANLIMACVKRKGQKTTLYNAACEPYLQQLCSLLVKMGAIIEGIGSNLLTIEGVSYLKGAKHRILSDMIEIGSFIGIAASTYSKVRIKNGDIHQLGIMPKLFQRLGVDIEYCGDDILINGTKSTPIKKNFDGSILKIDDSPWPGLSPDILSIMIVLATQKKGTVLFHQKMFERRLFFTDTLSRMGAQVILCDPHRVTVIGSDTPFSLHPTTMTSPDIRAGTALLIASLCAKGTSYIQNIYQIDRGYTQLDQRLNHLGACIKRFE